MNYLIILIIIIVILYFFRNNDRRSKINSKIPGPITLPILGNLTQMKAEGGQIHLVFQNWYKKFGTVYRIKMGNIETVVLTEYPTIKKAFITNSNAFASRFQRRSREKLNGCKNLVLLNGDLHSHLKTLALTELTAFRIKKIETNFISNEIKKLIQLLDRYAWNGEPFIINSYIKHFSMNVILCFVFGLTFPYGKVEESEEIIKIMEEYFQIAAVPIISDFIPILEPFTNGSKFYSLNKSLTHHINKLIERYSNEKKLRIENGQEKEGEDNTIIGKLLIEYEKGVISWETVTGTVIDLLVAGTDTSSSTVNFCLVELINNSDIQNKLIEDISRSLKKEDKHPAEVISYSKYRSLIPYLKMVIKETYRKYPAGLLGLPHLLTEDVEIDGHVIASGTQIIQNIFSTHRSEKQYPSPDEFDPERFNLDRCNKDPQQQFGLIQFGCGVRDCLGKSLADAEVFTLLASLLKSYEFSNPNPSKPLSDIGKFGVSYSCPENYITIKKRYI